VKEEKSSPAPAQGGGVVEIKVPASGESITSANVAAWRKKDGEMVKKGEVLVTLDTDKVSSEVEADVAGRLKILVHEGEEVAIGAVIATIDPAASEDAEEKPVASPAPAAKAEEKKPAESAPAKPREEAAPAPKLKPDLTVLST